MNQRLTKSMKELQEKHAKGTQEIDHPDRAPTGAPYRQIQQQQQQQAALAAAAAAAAQQQNQVQQREEYEREALRQKLYQREQDGNGYRPLK